MSTRQLLYEGPSLEKLFDRIWKELGKDARIIHAGRVRKGGIAGFFAKERFELVVSLPDDNANDLGKDQGEKSTSTKNAESGASRNRSLTSRMNSPRPKKQLGSAEVAKNNTITERSKDLDGSAEVAKNNNKPPKASITKAETAKEAVQIQKGMDSYDAIASSKAAHIYQAYPAQPNDSAPREIGHSNPAEMLAAMAENTNDHLEISTEKHPFKEIMRQLAKDSSISVNASNELNDTEASKISAGLLEAVKETSDSTNGTSNNRSSVATDYIEEAHPEQELLPTTTPEDSTPEDSTPEDKASLLLLHEPNEESHLSKEDSSPSAHLFDQLSRIGLPQELISATPELSAATTSTDISTALIKSLAAHLPPPPALPRTGKAILAVVGHFEHAKHLSTLLANKLGLDPAEIQLAVPPNQDWQGPSQLYIRSAAAAIERRASWKRRRSPIIVAVTAAVNSPYRSWARHVLNALEATSTWGIVDATTKTADIADWANDLGPLDALVLTGTDSTTSPAEILELGIPVAMIDNKPATPEMWAALIAARLSLDSEIVEESISV
ncbi:MAG: hypothetical protein M1519_01985 [Actinobacteria bacterium]|nr:hypothetical protein [Actinomycetota bacterium]